jgi:hypothetical protein
MLKYLRILEGVFVGEGIKKTHAYETSLKEAEFQEKKELFWSKQKINTY